MSEKLVFDTGCAELASRLLANTNGYVAGSLDQAYFADFELYQRFLTSPAHREVYVVGDIDSDNGFLRLYDAATCAFDEDALKITIVAGLTRKVSAFERRIRTRAFAAIPSAPDGNEMVVCDPSSSIGPQYENLHGSVRAGRKGKTALQLVKPGAPSVVLSIGTYDYLADRIVTAGKGAFERGEVKRSQRPAAVPTDFERSLLMKRFDNKDKPLPKEELLRLSQAADNNPVEIGHPLSARTPFEKISTPVAGRHVVIVGGTINDPDTMDLYRLANAAYEAGALSITMVVPYYGYSTMERKVNGGEAVKAKIRARLLSSIPRCPMGNRILMCDLHAEAMPGCFEFGLKPMHVYGGKVVVKRLALESADWLLASADINRIKWVESMAGDAKVDTAYTIKVRKGGQTRSVGQVGDVTDHHVRMYDDMIRTGGSAIGAANGYRANKASSVDMIATHGVMPGGSLKRMQDSGAFKQVIVTDTHPRAVQLQTEFSGFLRVESVADIIADHLTGRGFFANTSTLA